jgi:hypothetical protein
MTGRVTRSGPYSLFAILHLPTSVVKPHRCEASSRILKIPISNLDVSVVVNGAYFVFRIVGLLKLHVPLKPSRTAST